MHIIAEVEVPYDADEDSAEASAAIARLLSNTLIPSLFPPISSPSPSSAASSSTDTPGNVWTVAAEELPGEATVQVGGGRALPTSTMPSASGVDGGAGEGNIQADARQNFPPAILACDPPVAHIPLSPPLPPNYSPAAATASQRIPAVSSSPATARVPHLPSSSVGSHRLTHRLTLSSPLVAPLGNSALDHSGGTISDNVEAFLLSTSLSGVEAVAPGFGCVLLARFREAFLPTRIVQQERSDDGSWVIEV